MMEPKVLLHGWWLACLGKNRRGFKLCDSDRWHASFGTLHVRPLCCISIEPIACQVVEFGVFPVSLEK